MKSTVALMLILALTLFAPGVRASDVIARAAANEASRASFDLVRPDTAGADDRAVELRWSELGPVVSGHRVTAVLADGGRIIGNAVVVRENALVLDVKSASPSARFGGPNAPVPREAIAQLEVETFSGGGRTLGTVLGVLAGVVIGGWIAGESADSAGVGIPLFLGVASGFTIAGYYGGKSMSRQVTIIRIVP